MSYQSISIKEAISHINGFVNGWFLPYVQRPYVWGSRYESELYICKLFDSLLRGYPIGGLILWNTEDEIAYREFINDYEDGVIPKIVDKGLFGRKDKWLVYDGQQRLQTLYSCLKYTFNGKVLVFNLLFDMEKEDIDPNETGFLFVNKNEEIPHYYIRMNELFSKSPDEKVRSRKKILSQCANLPYDENILEKNLDDLWKVFVETDKKSLAYFLVYHNDESVVNEIFQRLNTGGVPLSRADLLFSRIKEIYYDYEENLQIASKNIYNITGKGYLFDAYNILQLIYFILKGSVRIDPRKVKSREELENFNKVWNEVKKPLVDFFTDFIWGQFKINNASIVSKKLALLPMLIYFYEVYKKGINFKRINNDNLMRLKQYFILSQINDWNLQSIIDNFARIIKEESQKSTEAFDFPIDKFIVWLNETKKRNTKLFEANFVEYNWFSLKLLTPDRIYQFDPDIRGRFNPEIDHIFPRNIKQQKNDDYKLVDTIWNMQPVKGDINNFKRGKHPKDFFSSEEGRKYFKDYDFLPTHDLNNKIWNNPLNFISKRKEKMIEYLKNEYKLELK